MSIVIVGVVAVFVVVNVVVVVIVVILVTTDVTIVLFVSFHHSLNNQSRIAPYGTDIASYNLPWGR